MEMDAKKLRDKVIAFVAAELCVKTQEISLETDLLKDLGVDGADAVELLEKFSDEFHVDVSGLDLRKSFGPEGGANPFCFLVPSWWAWHRNRKPITIGDMVRAVESGFWPHEDMRNQSNANDR